MKRTRTSAIDATAYPPLRALDRLSHSPDPAEEIQPEFQPVPASTMSRTAVCQAVWGVVTLLAGTNPPARANWSAAVGYDDLRLRLGGDLPVGASVEVTQVEAPSSGNYLPQFGTNPIVGAGIFAGKSFIDATESADDFATSTHAENVGRYFYSRDPAFSQTSGVATIRVYLSTDFSGAGFLTGGRGGAPRSDGSQVQNHSWIGDGSNDLVRRFDYAIARETAPFVACVGLNNGGGSTVPGMLAASFNAISVGRTDGVHSIGGTPAGYDGPGRTKPEIVAPFTATSYATAAVSSSAALLLDVANADPLLAGARRPETIKAILLAGATKAEFPGWNRTATRPLDSRFGAGELNIDESHRILASGQQPHGGTAPVRATGWDHATGSPSEPRRYRFRVPEDAVAVDLSILLAWNRTITDSAPGPLFEPSPSLANLDLFLRRVDSTAGSDALIDSSIGTGNNIEHLFVPVLPAGDYAIEVSADDAVDFALAWRANIVSEVNPDLSITLSPDLDEVTLTWDSIPGRTYTIEQSSGLTAWSAVPGAESVAAEGAETSVTLPVTSPDRTFFRVVDASP